mmetsp:Transcript_32933/g.83580  ORF Transcript_32933/g.83580 Transcript_32933/m.83580 type:complete len:159 (-) Transcript_32933:1921-2397(-)
MVITAEAEDLNPPGLDHPASQSAKQTTSNHMSQEGYAHRPLSTWMAPHVPTPAFHKNSAYNPRLQALPLKNSLWCIGSHAAAVQRSLCHHETRSGQASTTLLDTAPTASQSICLLTPPLREHVTLWPTSLGYRSQPYPTVVTGVLVSSLAVQPPYARS